MNDKNVEKRAEHAPEPRLRPRSVRSTFLHPVVLGAVVAAAGGLLVALIQLTGPGIKELRTLLAPGCTPSASHLYAAVIDGDEPTVRCLVDQAKINIDMMLQDPKNPSTTAPALYFAVATCNLSLTRYLLERNANAEFFLPGKDSVNLLTVASRNCGHTRELQERLVDRICRNENHQFDSFQTRRFFECSFAELAYKIAGTMLLP